MKSIVDIDPWLKPYANHIAGRRSYIAHKEKELLAGKSLAEFALGHDYFGLHRTSTGWVMREWAPNASKIFLVGDMNDWRDNEQFAFSSLSNGNWELTLPAAVLHHGDHYKLHIYWQGGDGLRIPAYARYTVQDETTKEFSAEVWTPEHDFAWTDEAFTPEVSSPLIYEAHVGMSGEKPRVATYQGFSSQVLPRIKADGYNTVQLMAIQEHPYYGSFGYHVSSFFAPSSRFGTPDNFKALVNEAHRLGLRVIVDIVHSHAVKNEAEGLSRFDGTDSQYFHAGKRGVHEAWDSRVFDYGKPEVMHFLLSNCRYWIDEYHVDGYRFDGVTSMLYLHHGLEKAFTGYKDYFGPDVDQDALAYLALANNLIHDIKPLAITIAEDMSGYPGLASKDDLGFDYRLSMGVPDLWIKMLKEKRDEDWELGSLFHELTTKRPEERVISYAESHDQALVGDKTLIFRLMDKEMYDHMALDDKNLIVERGMALHKIIRLLTASLNGGGYLNFMGNEFGHPEWIDFPREGNGWSYSYARRQWSLVDSKELKYRELGAFDKAMVGVIKSLASPAGYVTIDDEKHTLSFERDGSVFVFNLSPTESYTSFSVPAPTGSYHVVLDTDSPVFGGQGRVDNSLTYSTTQSKQGDELSLYLPARTALVLQRAN